MNIANKVQKSQLKRAIVYVLFSFIMERYAYGGGDETGYIDSLSVRSSDNLIYFKIHNGSPTGKPDCSTSNTWTIKDEGSVTGKQQFTTLLTAKSNNLKVHVTGTGECSSRRINAEEVNYIILPY